MYPVFLALRYARARIVTYLALLTVTVSVASFLVVMSVLEGFRAHVRKIVQETGSPLEIFCDSAGGIRFPGDLARRVEAIPGVSGASPYLNTMTLIRTAHYRTLGIVRGIDLSKDRAFGGLGDYLFGDLEVENVGNLAGNSRLSRTRHGRAPGPDSFDVPAGLQPREVSRETLEPWEDPRRPVQRGMVPVWWPAKRQPVERAGPPDDFNDDAGRAGQAPAAEVDEAGPPAPRGVIVGAARARHLGLNIGDEVIISAQGESGALRTVPFVVIGFYQSKTDWLNEIVLIDRRAAEELCEHRAATGISIWLKDPHNLATVRRSVELLCGEDPSVAVRDWHESQKMIFETLDMQNSVMMVVLLVFFAMTGCFIMAILVVLVTEKTRDIGTMRALGAGRLGVVFTFLSQGVGIVGLGTATGMGLGFVLAEQVNPIVRFIDNGLDRVGAGRLLGGISRGLFDMKDLPVEYSAVPLLSMAAVALTVGFLASLIPAWLASRMDPVRALRHE